MADMLKRELAPIPKSAWDEIDEVARVRIRSNLSARFITGVNGPLGMDAASVNTGRLIESKSGTKSGVGWAQREVLPLVEARASFKLAKDDLDNVIRGARDVDWSELERAARTIALFEEDLVYNGLNAAGMAGIIPAASNKAVTLTATVEGLPKAVGDARYALQQAGIGGPYSLVLGSKAFEPLNHTFSSGRTLMGVIKEMIDGQVLWSPAVKGGVLLSTSDPDWF